METSEDVFEFRKARIVCGDKGAGVGVMGGLRGPDCMRKEGTGNLFGDLTQPPPPLFPFSPLRQLL